MDMREGMRSLDPVTGMIVCRECEEVMRGVERLLSAAVLHGVVSHPGKGLIGENPG